MTPTRVTRRSAGVGLARDEAVVLELGHDPGDARRRDLLVLGQRAERDGPVALDAGERRQLARGEAGVGLLAEPAGQSGGADPQPAASDAASVGLLLVDPRELATGKA